MTSATTAWLYTSYPEFPAVITTTSRDTSTAPICTDAKYLHVTINKIQFSNWQTGAGAPHGKRGGQVYKGVWGATPSQGVRSELLVLLSQEHQNVPPHQGLGCAPDSLAVLGFSGICRTEYPVGY